MGRRCAGCSLSLSLSLSTPSHVCCACAAEREGEGDWFFNAEEVAAGHTALGAPLPSAALLGNGAGNGNSSHMVRFRV